MSDKDELKEWVVKDDSQMAYYIKADDWSIESGLRFYIKDELVACFVSWRNFRLWNDVNARTG